MTMMMTSLSIGVLAGTAGLFAFYRLSPQFGGTHSRERMDRIRASRHYHKGRFKNRIRTPLLGPLHNRLVAVFEYTFSRKQRVPERPLPVVPLDEQVTADEENGACRVFWLGHSSVLIRMDGKTIITDPVISHRPSPMSLAGPKSFFDPGRISPDLLPVIDIMVISHDHYDHLDYTAIRTLDHKTRRYVVPLGLGSHLEAWGVRPDKIHECDWWESATFETITVTATPARHFSGRGPFDRFKTLWASFVIEGSGKRLFFGGDSGYDDGFKAIGEAFGPFDLTFLECGAYSRYWPNVHMMPEETVRAHQDLQGKTLMPIHWARFNLSVHAWTEPVERLLSQAEKDTVPVITPLIGQGFEVGETMVSETWWR